MLLINEKKFPIGNDRHTNRARYNIINSQLAWKLAVDEEKLPISRTFSAILSSYQLQSAIQIAN